jgi:hypothetical protein
MTPWLREQLLTYKASLGDVAPDDPVFPTRDGSHRNKSNLNPPTRTLRAHSWRSP